MNSKKYILFPLLKIACDRNIKYFMSFKKKEVKIIYLIIYLTLSSTPYNMFDFKSSLVDGVFGGDRARNDFMINKSVLKHVRPGHNQGKTSPRFVGTK